MATGKQSKAQASSSIPTERGHEEAVAADDHHHEEATAVEDHHHHDESVVVAHDERCQDETLAADDHHHDEAVLRDDHRHDEATAPLTAGEAQCHADKLPTAQGRRCPWRDRTRSQSANAPLPETMDSLSEPSAFHTLCLAWLC